MLLPHTVSLLVQWSPFERQTQLEAQARIAVQAEACTSTLIRDSSARHAPVEGTNVRDIREESVDIVASRAPRPYDGRLGSGCA